MTLTKKSCVSVSSSAPRVSQKIIHSVDKKEGTGLRMGPSHTPPLRPQLTPNPQPTEPIESASETRVQSPESGVRKILTCVTEVIDQLPTPNLMIASDVERFATPRLKPCHSPPSKSLTHSESKQDTDKTKRLEERAKENWRHPQHR